MGRYSYSWFVEYYRDQWLEHTYIDAKSREDAIKKLRKAVPGIVEIVVCKRAVTW